MYITIGMRDWVRVSSHMNNYNYVLYGNFIDLLSVVCVICCGVDHCCQVADL